MSPPGHATFRINWRASSLHGGVVGFANSITQLINALGVHMAPSLNAAVTAVINSLLFMLSVALISGTDGGASATGH